LAKTIIKNNNAKKYTLFLIGLIFFSISRSAKAEVIINEFISHPNTGEKEWVELLNTGDSPIDLTGWKLTELSSPGTNPTENDFLSLSGTIDHILVFEIGSSKLNDTGDSVGLYNGENFVDRVTFGTDSTVLNFPIDIIAPTTGKSGAFVSGEWKSNQESTRGANNTEQESAPPVDEEGSVEVVSGGSGSASSKETKTKTPTQKTKIQIITRPISYVGIPFVLEGTGTDTFGDKLSHGRYFWNFGDGDFREVKVMSTDKFLHTYFYQGDYVVTLEYFPDSFTDVPEAIQKTTIKVINPDVSISAVGDEKDFFVELSNNSSYDVDISNWILLSEYRVFKIPRNTTIQAKKKIIISSRITSFSFADKSTLRLEDSEGNTVAAYLPVVVKKAPGVQHPVASNQDYSTENLSASALASDILGDKKEPSKPSSVIIPIFLLFIGSCAGAVYFIRRKKIVRLDPEDFEILDE
jgi:hypothetical protein